MVDLRTGRNTLIFAGIFGIIGFIMQFALVFIREASATEDAEFGNNYAQLNATALRALWVQRRNQLGFQVLNDVFNFTSFWLLLYGIFCLAKMFGKSASGMARLVLRMTFGVGTIIPAVEIIQNLGVYSAGVYITGLQSLPDVGFQSLEIAYLMSYARSIWLWSVTYLAQAVGFLTVSYLTFNEPGILPKPHAVLGVILGGTGLLVFTLSIFIFYNNIVALIFALIASLWGAILYPIWIFWLAAKMSQNAISQVKLAELESINKD